MEVRLQRRRLQTCSTKPLEEVVSKQELEDTEEIVAGMADGQERQEISASQMR